LGRIQDVPDPSGAYYKSIEPDEETILGIANDLQEQLYGKAGLVMEMETRNVLWKAWQACRRFHAGKIASDELIHVFFLARRYLRADLQLEDIPGIENRVKKMLDEVTRKKVTEGKADSLQE